METKNLDFLLYKDCLKRIAFPSVMAQRAQVEDDDFPYYDVIDPFYVDVKKITGSKAYRRLPGKTQVWPCCDNPYVRNRGSHTNDAVEIGCDIAMISGLNVGLVEAGLCGHDIGHVPFGHAGESFIAQKLGVDFRHADYSAIVAKQIERNGQGLNLCCETLEAIKKHPRKPGDLKISKCSIQEYNVVMFADKIAYTFSDLNDALLLGFFQQKDLPKEVFILGDNQRQRVMNCVFGLLAESAAQSQISFCRTEIAQMFSTVRNFMFDKLYLRLAQEGVEEKRALESLEEVYSGFIEILGLDEIQAITYISLMVDVEIKNLQKIFSGRHKNKAKQAAKIFINFPYDFKTQGFPFGSKEDFVL